MCCVILVVYMSMVKVCCRIVWKWCGFIGVWLNRFV